MNYFKNMKKIMNYNSYQS